LVVWVGYRPEQFRVVQGNPRLFSKNRGVVRTFCSDCGTSISYFDEALPSSVAEVDAILDDGSNDDLTTDRIRASANCGGRLV
jgi:hypothetical protein